MDKKSQWKLVKEDDNYRYYELHSNPDCKKTLQKNEDCKCDFVRYENFKK